MIEALRLIKVKLCATIIDDSISIPILCFSRVGLHLSQNAFLFSGCDEGACSFNSESWDGWCWHCWRQSAEMAGVLRKMSGPVEESQKQRDWVEMMSEKRRQQAEDSRIRREEEALRRREEEIAKKEEIMRKKEEDKKRREAIFEAYKLKKEAEKLKEEGMNYFSSRPPVAKLRPKSAGGSRMRPRPNTIHVDNR